MYKLYLDDIRTPRGSDWVIVRSFEEFTRTILEKGPPEMISFDHDLGWDPTEDKELPNGYDCAKWIVENNILIKDFFVHSANPVGAENITRLLDNYKKHVLGNK
jgi:hypothetical protein